MGYVWQISGTAFKRCLPLPIFGVEVNFCRNAQCDQFGIYPDPRDGRGLKLSPANTDLPRRHCQRKQIKPPLIALPWFRLGTGSATLGSKPRWVTGGGPTERRWTLPPQLIPTIPLEQYRGYCPTNANSSLLWQRRSASVGAERVPLGESGGASGLVGAAV